MTAGVVDKSLSLCAVDVCYVVLVPHGPDELVGPLDCVFLSAETTTALPAVCESL